MTETMLLYEAASPGLGFAFLDGLAHAIEALEDYPEFGVDLGGGLRRMVVHRFPFNIVYAIEDEAIVIVAVAHQHRRPDYWRGRA